MKVKAPKDFYQLHVNGIPAKKTFSKSQYAAMNPIWNQFNKYAKDKGATYANDSTAIGGMVWVLPNGDRLTIEQIEA